MISLNQLTEFFHDMIDFVVKSRIIVGVDGPIPSSDGKLAPQQIPPARRSVSVLVDQRRQQLLEMVRTRGFASLPQLVEQMGVSESTIRRDLDYLEETGVARRTHGGVFYVGPLPGFDEREPAEWDKKKLIAQEAVKMIEDGDTLLLDGGSTTYEVARLLVGRPLQVVTNSLPVANLFGSNTNCDLVLLGGYVYPRTGVTLGPYANEMLTRLSVRRTVLSVAGLNERGFYNSNLLLVETERAMMRAGEETIVVADSSKFGHQSLAHLAALSEAQHLVVDSEISPEWCDKVRAAGVNLHIAGPNSDGSGAGSLTGGSNLQPSQLPAQNNLSAGTNSPGGR